MATIPIAAVAAVAIFLAYRYILYPLFLSPLAKIPSAHWSSPISPIWILRTRKNGTENRTLHDAHIRLGSVVRIGPNALSVDGVEALRTVYQGGFEKTSWYSVFNNYGVPCMFATRGSKEHSLRKRMISNVYSKSHIQSSPAAKAQSRAILFGRLLPLIKESTSSYHDPHGIDIHSVFLATTMDFISAYIFGLRNSTNFLQKRAYRDHWLQLYLARNNYHFWPQEMPALTAFCSRWVVRLYPRWVDEANKELSEWNLRLCEKTKTAVYVEKTPVVDPADEPVVFKAVQAGIEREEETSGKESMIYPTAILQRDLSVASELLDHVLAGQETAGVTLTYLCWHLSQSLDIQHKLRTELLTLETNTRILDDGFGNLPDPKQLDALPLLHAIVMETLRLHAPLPGPQPRQTPFPSSQIGPYTVPGGVRVAALAYTVHRDERVFPKPFVWDHTRWLESETTDEQRKEMNRLFWAFGSGGRMCVGSNFAMNEMKFIVAAIYTNFTSYIVDDEGIEQTDGYSGRPASDRLFLRFEPVEWKEAI